MDTRRSINACIIIIIIIITPIRIYLHTIIHSIKVGVSLINSQAKCVAMEMSYFETLMQFSNGSRHVYKN